VNNQIGFLGVHSHVTQMFDLTENTLADLTSLK
jgi:hypothetical protein